MIEEEFGHYIPGNSRGTNNYLGVLRREGNAVTNGPFATGILFSGLRFPVYLRIFRVLTKSFKNSRTNYQEVDTMLIVSKPLRPVHNRYDYVACLLCQWHSFSTSYRRLAEKEPPIASSSPHFESPLADAPRSYGKAVTEFTPKPLSRPIGLPNPPRPGENWGIDTRSWKQRREDFVDYDKHLIRRKVL